MYLQNDKNKFISASPVLTPVCGWWARQWTSSRSFIIIACGHKVVIGVAGEVITLFTEPVYGP